MLGRINGGFVFWLGVFLKADSKSSSSLALERKTYICCKGSSWSVQPPYPSFVGSKTASQQALSFSPLISGHSYVHWKIEQIKVSPFSAFAYIFQTPLGTFNTCLSRNWRNYLWIISGTPLISVSGAKDKRPTFVVEAIFKRSWTFLCSCLAPLSCYFVMVMSQFSKIRSSYPSWNLCWDYSNSSFPQSYRIN